MPKLPGLDAMLAQTRDLIAGSRKAMVRSRDSIAISALRAALSEERRGACLPPTELRDVDAAKLLESLRSAIDQAAIDREVCRTAADCHDLYKSAPAGREHEADRAA